MRVVFIAGEDSFTWNVVDRLPFDRADVRLVHAADAAAVDGADVLVIGPGPTDPLRAGLVGIVHRACERRVPTLGICLGHQAIGAAFGARVVPVEPCHGRCSIATFGPSRHFPGVTGPVEVMRYHSLALAGVATPLRVVAATADGIPMAIEHDELPLAGLQFHPDSYATPRGEELVVSFFRNAR